MVDSDASSSGSTKLENDFDNNLPETVSVLKHPNGAKVYLVGTAHFSRESQEDVSFVIAAVFVGVGCVRNGFFFRLLGM